MTQMRKWPSIGIAILLTSQLLQLRLNAQSHPQTYTVIDLGTLGGMQSSAEGISNKGWIAGFSTLPGETFTHASLWRNGIIRDIGTPGLNSLIAYPFNERGEVAIHSEVPTPDQLGEDFCGFGTNLACPPFIWKSGSLIQLPTLGGENGHTSQVNNSGAAAGVAENADPDPTCIPQECVEQICPFQVLQTRPVVWIRGQIHELPRFPGDLDGGALVINDNGQIAGTSGKCIGSAEEALHALLWDHEKLTDLGNLGGSMNHHPQYINNRGQIVGYSNLLGDQITHAFLWQGVMTDLGTLPRDTFSFGEAINDNGVIGGQSCDAINCRAFIWQDGVMRDVNELIPSGSGLYLLDVLSINSRGEIVGDAVEISTGDAHGYLGIPAGKQAALDAPALPPKGGASPVQRPKISEAVRILLRARVGSSRLSRAAGVPEDATSSTSLTSAPIVTLSPSSLTFSTQAIGTTSGAKTVALKNTGTASLTITSIGIVGTNAGDFAQTHTCGSSLSAGASCSISITFKPTASGTRTAVLSTSDNAAGSPQKVSLSGIGTTAKVSPTSLNFGTVALGNTSSSKTVTLTNVATTTLTISGIAITGTDAGDFTQTHTCGSSLAPGASCGFSISFKPTASGSRTSALSVSDNAAGSPQKVSLSGVGTTAKLSPTSLNFGQVVIGNTSSDKAVTLTNVGTTTLAISSISITGTNAEDFAESNSCGSSLAADASCSIHVTFKPTASGTRTAALSVTDSASGSPQAVSLSGDGIAGMCVPEGGQCYPGHPCCAGLVCMPASTRAFCE